MAANSREGGNLFVRALRAAKAARSRLRYRRTQLMYRGDYRRVAALKDIHRGRRCFIVANGPSLKGMNLSHLRDEFVCILNNGGQAIGDLLPHANMHVATDNNRYRRFAEEFETNALQHSIPYRFFNFKVRRVWENLKDKAERPFFVIGNPRPLLQTGFIYDPLDGYGDCSTVVLWAVQIGYFMGFSKIYVLGVDLDYQTHGTYFYALQEKDRVHELDPKVQARRATSAQADEEFALALDAMRADGRELANAGVGGRLNALPRVDFEALFS